MMMMMIGYISFDDGFSSSSPVPPPPPISVPVWSFATTATTTVAATIESSTPCPPTTTTSMNVMTFCIPVSVSSPKLWALSFYHGTLTKDSFLDTSTRNNSSDNDSNNDNNTNISKNGNNNNSSKTNTGVLQLLTHNHAQLVKVLGKKSGRDISKSIACQEAGFPWWNNKTMNKKNTRESDDDNNSNITNDCTQHQQPQNSCNTCIDFDLLPGCALYIQVEWQPSSSPLIDAGDHVVAICEVKRTGIWKQEDNKDNKNGGVGGQVLWSDDDELLLNNDDEEDTDNNTAMSFLRLRSDGLDESNALYSGRLREKGII
jgi:hypothetical protein